VNAKAKASALRLVCFHYMINLSAISACIHQLYAEAAAHHQRTKHIDTKYHFQRQLLLAGIVRLQHQDTTVQVADILNTDLGRSLHRKHRDVLFGRKKNKLKLFRRNCQKALRPILQGTTMNSS
jgi:hypothetical protein